MIKKIALSILFLSFVSPVYATSEATVNVNNNVSSNSNSSSQTSTHTDITVETDGKTTHYESDESGNIRVESVNGESKITVNGQEKNASETTSPTSEVTTTKGAQSETIEDQEGQENTMAERIIEQIKRPFRILHLLFFWLP